nr:MAG TPA: distal tail protein [Caudoviricetes sp.]
MSNRVNLTLDVTKTGIQNPLIKIRQGDGGFETLRTTVTSNGEPLDLQGWTITFMGTTAGDHKIVDGNVKLIEAPNGIFDYTPNKAWGMDIGEFKIAYFKFVKGDGSASSANFRVNVIEAVNLTQEEAQNYISVIDTTIAEINNHLTDSLANVKQSIAETSSTASSLSVQVSSAVNQVNSTASNATSVTSSAVDNVNSVASSAVGNVNSVASSIAINEAELVHKTGTETIAGDKTFTSTINGNAATATKWQTARTLALAGDVTGSAAIDGSNNVSIATTGTNLVHKTGTETIAGDKTFTGVTDIQNPKQYKASFTIGPNTINLTRIGPVVYVSARTKEKINTSASYGVIPAGFTPANYAVIGFVRGNDQGSCLFQAGRNDVWFPVDVPNDALVSGSYLTSDTLSENERLS